MPSPTAKDLMSSDVLAARADWTVQQLAAFLTEHAISGAPVVSEGGALVGVVSLSDIVQHRSTESPATEPPEDAPPAFYQQGPPPLHVPDTLPDTASAPTVQDIMMPTLFCVDEDTPAAEIADKMIRGRLHRLLVVRSGSHRDVVGIITTLDLLQIVRDMAPTES